MGLNKAASISLLLLLGGLCLGAQEGKFLSLRFGVAPFGGYDYNVPSTTADFTGGFREVSVSLAYDLGRARSWGTDFSLGAYFDFKGYLYQTDGGYQSSSIPFVALWGLPNFSVGVEAGWKALSIGKVDLMTWWGLEYAHYFQTESISSPGIGASIRAGFDFPLRDSLKLNLGVALHASTHPESGSYYAFKLIEAGPTLGLALAF